MVHMRHCYTLLHWQKFTGSNSGDQKVNFGLHAECDKSRLRASAILKLFPGYTPDPVKRGKGREEREGREGLGGEGGKGKEIEGRGRGRRDMGKREGEGERVGERHA
jgi:hypothetical protein